MSDPAIADRPPRVAIVGAGLAGLCCARRLARDGIPCVVLEASDDVGGRVRTDSVDGFRLDRGFQVLLTAYPEARAVLDLDALDLRAYYPGALVRAGGRFHLMADPWSRPFDALRGLFAPVGSLADGLRVARLRARVRGGAPESLFAGSEETALESLQGQGFSTGMIDGFLRPLFGGATLDPALTGSSRMFQYIFRMFSEGPCAVPAKGMQEIPRQIAAALPEGAVRTGARVESVEPSGVTLRGGERVAADAVVVAADGWSASGLLPGIEPPPARPVTCLYYDADAPPVDRPVLVIDGEGRGPVNNLCVPSRLAPETAPAGRALVSATVLDDPGASDDALDAAVREQMTEWFGEAAAGWRLLRVYRIPRALPAGTIGRPSPHAPPRLDSGLFVCGDHRDTPSIQGAMESGRLAAEAVAGTLAGSSAARA